ncbi:MAG: hypothetical protein R3Y33_04975 [Clostridia bacterium]
MTKICKEKISEFDIDDAVFAINETLLNCKDNEEIVFEKAQYDIHTLYAKQEFCFISNNDYGLKNLAFPLFNKKNITIDGAGSKLNCIGRILPFYMTNCENITIKNFEIDYQRPFFSQGEIMETADNYAVFNIDKNIYPYEIFNGLVRFTGEEYDSLYVHGLLEFDKNDRRPIPNVFDNSPCCSIRGEETEAGYLKVFFDWEFKPTVGNIMTIKHEERYCPAIAVDKCKNIKFENITIRNAGTMGVVAQFSENISLDKVDIFPDPKTDKVMSINADATHFVNCTGTVLVENSRLESMLDDIINVHGNYFRVSHIINNKNIIVEIPHFQQVGAYGIKDGAKILICNKNTMLGIAENRILRTKVINNKYYNVELKTEFDFDPNTEYCIDDIDAYPEVIFRNNVCGFNRARGLLLTSSKTMLVENNVIDSEGSAVKANGDMHNWYESTNLSKLIIRGNKLRRRNQINWGLALIDIDPGMKKQVEGEYFHGDIIIENNECILDETPLFMGYSFNSVEIKNNKIIDLSGKIKSDKDLTIDCSNCGKVFIENNIY